jgi:hypothetical protein
MRKAFFGILIALCLAVAAPAQNIVWRNTTTLDANTNYTYQNLAGVDVRISFVPIGGTVARSVVTGCHQDTNVCEFVGIWDSIQPGVLPIFGVYDQFKFVNTCTGCKGLTIQVLSSQSAAWATSYSYSPAQLNLNALTLPANPTPTADTTIVNTVGVKALALSVNCTQPASINVRTYAEDGTTSLTTYQIRSAVPAGQTQLYLGTEVDLAGTTGSAGTTTSFRLPQKSLSFFFVNTGATPGTCTGRLLNTW